MTLVSVNGLAKSYGAHVCFSDVNFTLTAGQKVGLIGANGTGKTTLLKILNEEESYEGNLIKKKGLTIARLKQSPVYADADTPKNILLAASEKALDLEQEIQSLYASLADLDKDEQKKILRKISFLEEQKIITNSDDALRKVDSILHGLGLVEEQFDQPVVQLSGGERCRVALAELLLNSPDLWLLDEPTNHLDLAGINLLERFLKNTSAAAIIISHDRRFLDNVTTDIWDLENKKIYFYKGNYSQSRKLREERQKNLWKSWLEQKQFVSKQKQFIDKWRAGTRSRQAQSRAKLLSKVKLIDEPLATARLAMLNLQLAQRLGDLVLEVNKLSVGYPNNCLIENFSISVKNAEVLAIVGGNGCGKTTFLKTILSEIPELSGSYRWGPTVKCGYLGQHEVFLDEERTPLEYLQDNNLGSDDQDRRDKLGAMLFSQDEAVKPIKFLSGGERKRLMLTRLLLEGHNVLLLDEPTNHLDIASAEAVTLALSGYEGTVIVISHDRYFLDDVADRVLWFDKGEFYLTTGGFTEADKARESRNVVDKNKNQILQNNILKNKEKEGLDFSRLSLRKIEAKIIANEDRVADIYKLLEDSKIFTDKTAVENLNNELVEIKLELQALEEEYYRR